MGTGFKVAVTVVQEFVVLPVIKKPRPFNVLVLPLPLVMVAPVIVAGEKLPGVRRLRECI